MLQKKQLSTRLQEVIKFLDRLTRIGDTTEGPDADNGVNGSSGDFVIGELFYATGYQDLSEPSGTTPVGTGMYIRMIVYISLSLHLSISSFSSGAMAVLGSTP